MLICYLRNTNTMFPGSYYAPKIKYITVVGNSIRGKQRKKQQLLDHIRQMLFQQTPDNNNNNDMVLLETFAYESYLKVCGSGNQTGDGVTPCLSGHLDGATQITLSGVQHSFHFPGDWYGSSNVIHLWHDVMLSELFAKEYEEQEEKINVKRRQT